MPLPYPTNPNLQAVPVYQPGRPIEEVARELGLPADGIIKVASNENPLGPSRLALAAMRKAVAQVNLYPDGNAFYLKQKLAAKLGVTPANLILGNGSNEVIEFIGHTLIAPGKGANRRFAPRGAGAWAALSRSGLLPACKKWRSRRAGCWLTQTSFTTPWALVKCGVRNGECGMQNGVAQPMPWLAYPQGGNRKTSDGRLVRPSLRGALPGLEIATSQTTLPVGAG